MPERSVTYKRRSIPSLSFPRVAALSRQGKRNVASMRANLIGLDCITRPHKRSLGNAGPPRTESRGRAERKVQSEIASCSVKAAVETSFLDELGQDVRRIATRLWDVARQTGHHRRP